MNKPEIPIGSSVWSGIKYFFICIIAASLPTLYLMILLTIFGLNVGMLIFLSSLLIAASVMVGVMDYREKVRRQRELQMIEEERNANQKD